MKFYFLNHNIMTKKAGLLTTIATATALVTSPANADTNKEAEPQKIEQKEIAQKIEKITCTTKLACEALSHSIQAQIDELNIKIQKEVSKGGNANWNLLGYLQQDLDKLEENKINISIAVENNKQENEDKIHTKQEKIITEENEKQARLTKVEERLNSIEGSL